jgi:Protein of unknown function (DUF2911)
MKTSLYTVLMFATMMIVSCSGTSTNSEEQSEATEHQMDEHQHDAAEATESKPKKKPASPKQQAMAMVGNNHIHIEYSSPSVRGRVIWGGLVPYGKVWSTGAHKATSINFPEAVIINGTEIPAGKYGFFTIPGEETWTVILNKNWDMHLADDYQEAEDVIRFEVRPERLDNIQEALAYKVESTGDNTGVISVAWENVKISFTVTNK